MSHLRNVLADYLSMRRALGYKMDQVERRLRQFIAFAEDNGETHVRTVTALAWATLPPGADPIWTHARLADVRIFARHLHMLDDVSEVPPDDLLPARRRRTTPYLYTPQEVADLMRATDILTLLTEAEIDALLAAPDRATWTGRRDTALFSLAAQTGLRASELIGLTRADVQLGAGAHVSCTGKGRKQRITPLTSGSIGILRAWLAERAGQPGDPLFPTQTGRALSRDALERRLAKYVAETQVKCPTMAKKRVSVQVLRHSAAMRLLRAGIDTSVIALWLGHEQIETTQIYLHADLQIKERALERTAPITMKPGRFRPTDHLLAFLEAL